MLLKKNEGGHIMKKNILIFILFIFVSILAGCGSKLENPEIKVYTRDTTSGTRDGFFSTINFKDAVADNTALVKGYVEVTGNGDMINLIKNDEYGIGYISLSSLENSGLKGLVYNAIDPTEENVLNGTYLLTRNFNYVVRNEYNSTKVEEIVEAFVAYLNTKEGKTTIKANDGIIAVNANDPSWNDIKSNYPIASEDNRGITIRFGGSTSVEKIAKALSSEFSLKCGNFIYEHNHTGSGDAYKRTQGGEKDGSNKLDIAFASREFKLSDTELLSEGSYGKICTDAIVAVVNNKNKITSITDETLKSIYNGTITKWNEVK
jgi:phosphate transport system substrate-binding protein